jgi:hypothetical protein
MPGIATPSIVPLSGSTFPGAAGGAAGRGALGGDGGRKSLAETPIMVRFALRRPGAPATGRATPGAAAGVVADGTVDERGGPDAPGRATAVALKPIIV